MVTEMDEKIDSALMNVLAMLRPNVKHDEALKFSQAALNLAHTLQILEAVKKRASAS
jgi:hypothetical protein